MTILYVGIAIALLCIIIALVYNGLLSEKTRDTIVDSLRKLFIAITILAIYIGGLYLIFCAGRMLNLFSKIVLFVQCTLISIAWICESWSVFEYGDIFMLFLENDLMFADNVFYDKWSTMFYSALAGLIGYWASFLLLMAANTSSYEIMASLISIALLSLFLLMGHKKLNSKK